MQDLFRKVSLAEIFLEKSRPLPLLLRLFLMVRLPQVIIIIIIVIVIVIIVVIVIIDFCLHVYNACQREKDVSWTNKQPIIVVQKPGKSRTTSNENCVGKKRKRKMKVNN